MSTMLQVRIDDDLKTQAALVYDQLGMDLSTAVRIFLKKSVAVNGIPFEVKNDSSTNRAMAAINNMRRTAKKNGLSDMSLDEIDNIIANTRTARKRTKWVIML